VQEQIDYVKRQGSIANGPQKVLIIGASTGYGLSSRIVAAFGLGARTIGVFFEKESNGVKTASAGWYNSAAFEQKAHKAGLYAKSFNGDAYSDDMKAQVTATIKKDWGGVDLVIYSLAAPRREHPRTGQIAKSVLKPIGKEYTNISIDLSRDQLETVTLPAATQEEIDQTISVMGGEDWEFWIDSLDRAGLLSEGAVTVAYSYVGPELTRAVYRNGTIGKAKGHLEATAKKLDARLKKINGRALISVNKALVTQSSSAIPFIPLYFILLSKVMREKGIDEGCIEQMDRLFRDFLYKGDEILVDENGFIRLDDREMRKDVQQMVAQNWDKLTNDNLKEFTDLDGYHKDFLKLFGFSLEGVDYNVDVDPDQKLLSISA
jgi:enoyl-[acyl-carrier protein] reductase/trans-2-enoyl-CoA reductase (NAD+)